MTTVLRDRLRRCYAILIIAGVLGVQFWTIVPRRYNQAWYWPFMNYPMYSAAHYPGDEFGHYELWAGPADQPESMRPVSSRELHLTTFKLATALRMASNRDAAIVYGRDESASEFLGRLAAEHVTSPPLRLQIWQHTWTFGPAGPVDRAGVRELKREWTPACELGPAGARCSSEIP